MSKLKDLKNIKKFGYSKLAAWGMFGALVLLAYSIVASILNAIIDIDVLKTVLGFVGLALGVAYAILGVFVLIKVINRKQGKFWVIFLIAGIFAILTPLGYYSFAGIGLSIVAGILFLVYTLLESK